MQDDNQQSQLNGRSRDRQKLGRSARQNSPRRSRQRKTDIDQSQEAESLEALPSKGAVHCELLTLPCELDFTNGNQMPARSIVY
jgi:hypothetical protein